MSAPARRVGVLALQGDFALHRQVLEALGAEVVEVRTPDGLSGVEGLILPGGESTAMLKLMEPTRMEDAIREFHRAGGAVFGTCAGLILLAVRVTAPAQRSLGLLDVDVTRNAYGRQIHSFETVFSWSGSGEPLRAAFIRAPKIARLGTAVHVLARADGDPVLVRSEGVLGATFHPEVTGDSRVHRYFLEEVMSVSGVSSSEAAMGRP